MKNTTFIQHTSNTMKNHILTLFVTTLLLCMACNKESDAEAAYFNCKIDGQDYKCKGLTAYAVNFETYYNMYGVESLEGGATIYLSVPADTKAGTYPMNSDFVGYYVDKNNVAYNNLWGQGNGSITIEEIDEKHVKGTFTLNAFDSDTETIKKTITDGSFDVVFR